MLHGKVENLSKVLRGRFDIMGIQESHAKGCGVIDCQVKYWRGWKEWCGWSR